MDSSIDNGKERRIVDLYILIKYLILSPHQKARENKVLIINKIFTIIKIT